MSEPIRLVALCDRIEAVSLPCSAGRPSVPVGTQVAGSASLG